MSDLDALFQKYNRRIASLENKIEAQDRYINNLIREGRVTKVHADGTVEVDSDGLPTAKIPWQERAGSQKTWDPPSVGERVMVFNPSGDPGRGIATLGGYSDENKAPHDKVGEKMRKNGESSDLETKDARTVKSKTITFEASETIILKCGSSTITMTNGKIALKSPSITENE